jgi:hypothetical protein
MLIKMDFLLVVARRCVAFGIDSLLDMCFPSARARPVRAIFRLKRWFEYGLARILQQEDDGFP